MHYCNRSPENGADRVSSVTLRDFWHSPPQLNRFSGLLLLGSILILLVSVAVWMANRPVFVVKRVIVEPMGGGLRHVSAPQIHAAIIEALNGTVLSTNLRPVYQSIQAIPWVRSATVRRIWPNRLLVRIEEQRAVAIWPNGHLVNDRGETFSGLAADHDTSCGLVSLFGPPGSQQWVLERTRQLSQWLAPLNRPLRSVTLSEQYSWTVELTGGLTLELGRDTLATSAEERVRMFVKTQPWLTEKLKRPRENLVAMRADLRYATGYAFSPLLGVSIAEVNQSKPLCIGVQT
jgi:cell division protein FtsQ